MKDREGAPLPPDIGEIYDYTAADGTVTVYDFENPKAWVESDTSVGDLVDL